jgi:alcohol dehydrogenase class IV
VRLRDLGVAQEQLEKMAEDTCRYMGGTLPKTPGEPGCEEIRELLEAAW